MKQHLGLPDDVELVPVYSRTALVDQVLHTVEKNLLELKLEDDPRHPDPSANATRPRTAGCAPWPSRTTCAAGWPR